MTNARTAEGEVDAVHSECISHMVRKYLVHVDKVHDAKPTPARYRAQVVDISRKRKGIATSVVICQGESQIADHGFYVGHGAPATEEEFTGDLYRVYPFMFGDIPWI